MKDFLGGFNDFFSLLEREYDGGNPFLDSNGYKRFQRYYHHPFKNKARRYLFRNLYHSRLRYMMSLLSSLKNPIILDAGCGLGSESIFFSFFGARVVGVDLEEEKIRTAEKRKLFYKDLIKGKVEFVLGDIFEVIKEQKFDIVWMNEAISHIHPAERFLRLARQQLNRGGRVVISEGNGGNPCILLRRLIETGRCSWITRHVQDPKTGKDVRCAAERLFSLKEIANILKKVGFSIGHTELTQFTVFFVKDFRIFSKMIRSFEQWLDKQKFGSLLALSYRIEGKAD